MTLHEASSLRRPIMFYIGEQERTDLDGVKNFVTLLVACCPRRELEESSGWKGELVLDFSLIACAVRLLCQVHASDPLPLSLSLVFTGMRRSAGQKRTTDTTPRFGSVRERRCKTGTWTSLPHSVEQALPWLVVLFAAGSVVFVCSKLHNPVERFLRDPRPGARRVAATGTKTPGIVVEPDLDGAYRGDEDDAGGRQGEGAAKKEWGKILPRCFSSSQADPGEGAWRACEGGVEESPARNDVWELPLRSSRGKPLYDR